MNEDDQSTPAAASSGKRRTAREAIFLGARIESRRGSSGGRIRNISATGALLEIPEALSVGEVIVISFRGVDRIGATVKRCTQKGYGVHFEKEIDPASCRTPTGPQTRGPENFLLHLREENRRPIWDNSEMVFKRPRLK